MSICPSAKVPTCKISFLFIAGAATLGIAIPVKAQRLLGLDVSAYQGDITATEWNTFKRPTDQQVGGISGDGRDFVFIRSSRGGTTGEDHRQGAYPSGNNTFFNLSERYDDPYFVQNITRATTAGLFAGSYHFARPDVIVGTANSDGSTVTVANTGTDEANHFIQMAGPWMRPGYLAPMYDFEAGQSQRTAEQMAQFSADFANRIYAVMGIRPGIYSNGSYAGTLQSASAALRDELAKPPANLPSVVAPDYPQLWSARWPNQTTPSSIDVQNAHPKDTYTPIYGPWDDYGVTHPWSFWQYASTMKLNGNNAGTSSTDVDVSQGDIEWVKDHLVPAVLINDASGDWSTLANWNSGQTPVQPPVMSGQLAPLATGPLPTPRSPGASGSGPTSGQYDTVILERPNANITTTISTGSFNVRKLYMREALSITGGTLTINYDPNYVSDTVNYPNALRSGPISAQFSGPVSLSGSGNLSVNTLQVDAAQTFTLAGSSGTLTFKTINLMPHSTTPSKIAISGEVNIAPLANGTATIANGSGTGATGFVDLTGGTRAFNVSHGAADVDLAINVPMQNGGLIKNGLGTMLLGGANTYGGGTIVSAGTLTLSGTSARLGSGNVTVQGTSAGTSLTIQSGVNNAVNDGATLSLFGGGAAGVADQGFASLGTGINESVGALLLNGIAQASGLTFGSTASSAVIQSDEYFSGTGVVLVGLLGDFNGSGSVDAQDFVIWRTSPTSFGGDAGYNLWRANFGHTAPGSGTSLGSSAVPEPSVIAIAISAMWPFVSWIAFRRRRR